MSEPKLPRPTDAELAILQVMWERGPSTVREVHEALNKGDAGTGYTTVLKLMQIMTEKGLVERDESQRAHVYRTRASQQKTQRQLVTDLLNRAFGGSPARLAMQALSTKKASAEELAELRQLLDTLEEEEKP
ncbi:BlaI/MecI/CopY family transcriptional regulator [Cystobacter fuscus]|uniref:BlaI/MecI/CopY family transcriptional regulator n=1 Tax=Cystobacter fuscus TaxID=43 RepID=UPI002B2C7FDC|nr:BlaI/MecI/CopY family transcriptional regulator [Cystobacter fuscus]